MTTFDVLSERKVERVMEETWGHLRPANGKTYRGHLVFATSPYSGETLPVVVEFAGLEDSPWFYEAMMNFIFAEAQAAGGAPAAAVQRFDGIYSWGPRKGHVFRGTVRPIDLSDERAHPVAEHVVTALGGAT